MKLELEIKGFSEKEFLNLKKIIAEKQVNLSQIDQQLGGILEKIDEAKKQVDIIQKTILELKKVKGYISKLEQNRGKYF